VKKWNLQVGLDTVEEKHPSGCNAMGFLLVFLVN
jgi:hypothetical protein